MDPTLKTSSISNQLCDQIIFYFLSRGQNNNLLVGDVRVTKDYKNNNGLSPPINLAHQRSPLKQYRSPRNDFS